MLAYMKRLHKKQHLLGGQSHHEQSAKSRAPSNGSEWPWAISNQYMENSVTVAACAVRILLLKQLCDSTLRAFQFNQAIALFHKGWNAGQGW